MSVDSVSSESDPVVYADDEPVVVLTRKVRLLKFVAILETIFYVVLIPLMIQHFLLGDSSTFNTAARKIVSYFHGMIVVGFAAIAFDLRRQLRWSWAYFAFIVLAGPVGALFCHTRLRSYTTPELASFSVTS